MPMIKKTAKKAAHVPKKTKTKSASSRSARKMVDEVVFDPMRPSRAAMKDPRMPLVDDLASKIKPGVVTDKDMKAMLGAKPKAKKSPMKPLPGKTKGTKPNPKIKKNLPGKKSNGSSKKSIRRNAY